MVAPQSRTLVRYRNMIARRAPLPCGCVVVLAHEASPANEGGAGALVRCVNVGYAAASFANAPRMLGEGVLPLFSFPLNT